MSRLVSNETTNDNSGSSMMDTSLPNTTTTTTSTTTNVQQQHQYHQSQYQYHHYCSSAPGKVILFGEHSVVYGQPAIAAALSDLRIFVHIHVMTTTTTTTQSSLSSLLLSQRPNTERMIHICMPDLPQHLNVSFSFDHFLATIYSSSTLLLLQCPPTLACTQLLESFIQQHMVRHHYESNDDKQDGSSSGSNTTTVDKNDDESAIIHALLPVLYLLAQFYPTNLLTLPSSSSSPSPHHPHNTTTCCHSITITVRSKDLPAGAGLGSSAAFGVACTAAFVQWKYDHNNMMMMIDDNNNSDMDHPNHIPVATNNDPNPNDIIHQHHQPITMTEALLEEINTYAYYSEMLLHGRPSGIDNTVSTYGGILTFTRKSHHEVSFHRIGNHNDNNNNDDNTTVHEDYTLFKNQYHLILVDTHIPRQTKLLVGAVRKLYDTHPTIITPIFDAMGQIAVTFCNHITKQQQQQSNTIPILNDGIESNTIANNNNNTNNDNDEVLSLVRMNQSLLCTLGVSHPSIDHICHIINHPPLTGRQSTQRRQLSQYAAAKLTGAGGGGCVMILLHVLPSLNNNNNNDINSTTNNENHPTLQELQGDIIESLQPQQQQNSNSNNDPPPSYTFLSSTVGGDGVLFVPYMEYIAMFSKQQ